MLQLLKAFLQASAQSSPGAGFSTGLASAEFEGGGSTTFTRVAMGGGGACTLVGDGTTK